MIVKEAEKENLKSNSIIWEIILTKEEVENIIKKDFKEYLQNHVENTNFDENSLNSVGLITKLVWFFPEKVLEKQKKVGDMEIELVWQDLNNPLSHYVDVILKKNGKKRYVDLKTQNTLIWIEKNTNYNFIKKLVKKIPLWAIGKVLALKEFWKLWKIESFDRFSFWFVHFSASRLFEVLLGKKITMESKFEILKKFKELLSEDLLNKFYEKASNMTIWNKKHNEKTKIEYNENNFLKEIEKSIEKIEKERKVGRYDDTIIHKEVKIIFFFHFDWNPDIIEKEQDKYFYCDGITSQYSKATKNLNVSLKTGMMFKNFNDFTITWNFHGLIDHKTWKEEQQKLKEKYLKFFKKN